jgi:acyl-CoA dehydrogenase
VWRERLVDFTENPDHRLIRDAVRETCARFPDEYWALRDQSHTFPWEFYQAMAEGGWIGIAIPAEFGGGGCGITEASIVLEEVAASGACMNGASSIHLSIFGMHPVVRHGSDELKQRYLPRVATGDLHVAFGVTEPDAGLDTTAIRTRAVRDGDGYRVTGRKVWTSKALESERVLLLTRTTPVRECAKRTDGMTLFVAPLRDPAVTITPIPKLGRNAVASCEVVYDGLYVEAADRVGEEGRGFTYLLDGLNAERVLVASEALGTGRAALRRAVAYAKERIVFGRPIGKNQGISFPLAEAYARLGAAELAIRQASWRIDHGLPAGEDANLAKFLAAEAGF